MAVSPNDPRPAYTQIADELRRAIAAGELAPGQRLASGRELARKYGVAPMTIQQALRELRDEGLVIAWQGRGVFVRDAATEAATATDGSTVERIIAQLDSMHGDLQRLEGRVADLETKMKTSPARARRPDD